MQRYSECRQAIGGTPIGFRPVGIAATQRGSRQTSHQRRLPLRIAHYCFASMICGLYDLGPAVPQGRRLEPPRQSFPRLPNVTKSDRMRAVALLRLWLRQLGPYLSTRLPPYPTLVALYVFIVRVLS
jgi:hypothetical protein